MSNLENCIDYNNSIVLSFFGVANIDEAKRVGIATRKEDMMSDSPAKLCCEEYFRTLRYFAEMKTVSEGELRIFLTTHKHGFSFSFDQQDMSITQYEATYVIKSLSD